jgi:hypothetical protein
MRQKAQRALRQYEDVLSIATTVLGERRQLTILRQGAATDRAAASGSSRLSSRGELLGGLNAKRRLFGSCPQIHQAGPWPRLSSR